MDTGLKIYRNYFSIKFGTQFDARYGELYPVFRKIMYPGDVFKINADLLIRYQPMLAPPMNDCVATVRFAFVPLRLVECDTELIVTGSNDGHLSTETLPVMDSVFKHLTAGTGKPVNQKHSLLDYMCDIPAISTDLTSELKTKLEASKSVPAAYFPKAYYRFWWDYYRDENLFTEFTGFDDFWDSMKTKLNLADGSLMYANLKKDRLTSSLPWQLKAVAAPRIPINVSGTFSGGSTQFNFGRATSDKRYTGLISSDNSSVNKFEIKAIYNPADGSEQQPFVDSETSWTEQGELDAFNAFTKRMENALNQNNTLAGTVGSIDTVGIAQSEIRDVGALTRIYERLARCGSRYTEYLYANFGVAPRDDTLQRAQYLGGFKTRIVTTEVVQTAGAGDNPVGTLRGHGITHGTQTINPFMAKEIGVIVGVLDVKPETIYAQGVDRELTARSRFDFMNPSFQHLSEQEVRKGEIYFDVDTDTDGNLKNDETFGFQPYGQELRRGIKHVNGDMRDSLSFWNQALIFSERPSLNQALIRSTSHLANYNRPFSVSGSNAYPMVIDFGGIIEAYRPLVKDGTPGLFDHN